MRLHVASLRFAVLALITLAPTRLAAAQQSTFSPAAPMAEFGSAVVSASTSGVGVGPTLDAAAVGVRHAPSTTTGAAPARRPHDQSVVLMIVGGAALVSGLLIGGGAGDAIAVGGVVVGVIGLYQYLQ